MHHAMNTNHEWNKLGLELDDNTCVGQNLKLRAKGITFEKGLHVFFPQKNFYMQMNF
jgi:hypothetical protein